MTLGIGLGLKIGQSSHPAGRSNNVGLMNPRLFLLFLSNWFFGGLGLGSELSTCPPHQFRHFAKRLINS